MTTVEIFRTNIKEGKEAQQVILSFAAAYPLYKANFDLEDRDRILRVEASHAEIAINSIVQYMQQLGYSCEPLE